MACDCKTRRNLSMNVTEITVLAIALCIIVALFSIPIVFYYVSVSIIKLLLHTLYLDELVIYLISTILSYTLLGVH